MTMKIDDKLKIIAKGIVVLAFRNGPIEDIHAGKSCPICHGNTEYSHITDNEMKTINIEAVNWIYSLLRLQRNNPKKFEKYVESVAKMYAYNWNEPELNWLVKELEKS